MASVSSVAMIARTTSSSMSVNPRGRITSPFPVRLTVDADALGSGVDVEHVVAFLRVIGRARVAALSPGLRGGELRVGREGVARHAAQEVDAFLLRALLILDTLDQVLKPPGITRFAGTPLDAIVIERLLVAVDSFADFAERAAQVLFLVSLD